MTHRTVVHVVTTLGTGGTERQLVELVRGLGARGWRSRVVCFRPGGAFAQELCELGVTPSAVRLHGTLKRVGTLWALLRLAREVRAGGAVIAHCHDPDAAVLGVPAARLAGLPVIAARRDLGNHLRPAQRVALRVALEGATRVLTNAATIAARLERDGIPASRLAIIPNGIDLARFDERARVAGARWSGAPTVVSVGRMTHPQKGHDDLIEAAALLRARVPEARVLIVGDGPREPELRALAARRGATNVVFLGRRPDVPSLLARAHVACHAARAEGLPNAVLEAMAAARPIVATAAGGTPELIQDGIHGVLVRPEAPDALADGIQLLLQDRARAQRLAEAARARVEADLHVERLACRTAALYDELV